jgi:hypothetical protein
MMLSFQKGGLLPTTDVVMTIKKLGVTQLINTEWAFFLFP